MGRHTQGLVIDMVIEIDSVNQCGRPKTWM
jgi:hypothetical protein